MDGTRFDQLTRFLAARRPRRALLAFALGALSPAARRREAAAGPGCKNVGRRCRRAGQCCSNICKGKKRCRAHDARGCEAGQVEGFCGGADVPCTTSTGLPGRCNTTTGKAGYCARDGLCAPCTKDADCEAGFGAGAACVLCAPCPNGRGCASLNPVP